jgi:hypothetical protein
VRREDFDALDGLDANAPPPAPGEVLHKTNGKPVAPAFVLTGIDLMLNEPEDLTRWVVEDRIPAGSVCLLVAKPKVGKTTAARHLAVSIIRGDDWLGSQCELGVVWYIALEGRKADHLSHFRQFHLTEEEGKRLQMYIGPAKPGLMKAMMQMAGEQKPALIIVDTLQRLLQVKSMDDYAEVTKAFDPVIQCARESGAALLLIHHAGKATDRDPLDSVLGSTAISGSVDNTLILTKLRGFRTLTTRQRIGPDLEERVIRLTDDGRVLLGDMREQAEMRAVMDTLYKALANAPEVRLTSSQWLELVEGRKQTLLRGIRQLVTEGTISCVGSGTKHSPYVYSVPAVPVVPSGSHEVLEPNQDQIVF